MIFRRKNRREFEVEDVTKFHESLHCSTCGKVFHEAVKARDLSIASREFYYACPRCLTEVNVQNDHPKNPTTTTSALSSPPKFSFKCPHYENLRNRIIPDECLVCSKLIECTKKS